MEASPLTQQARPESFQPKVVQLYEVLFRHDVEPYLSEGFWAEFFLLRPDKAHLQTVLEDLNPEDLLQIQAQTTDLFIRSIQHFKAGKAPADQYSLETLTIFLNGILNKRYTNPNSDIIALLGGFDEVDLVVTDFINALDVVIRGGSSLELRQKAIEVALSMTSGAYQTSLVSYFTHRDLFPSLMKFIHDCDTPDQSLQPFLLLGLLANYNKFEFQNPYRLRLDDFVNEATIQKIIRTVGVLCSRLRNQYVAIQEDLPEGWTLSSTISFLSLGYISPGAASKPQPPSPEDAKALFAALPEADVAIMLATYDFVNANKLFCFNLATLQPENKGEEPPLNSFLSFTSYLLQHAYRSTRASLYGYLNLIILRILVEDPAICKRICSDENKTTVRLCRQRQPYLPISNADRVPATIILDMMIDTINHNLRRHLDVDLYISCVSLILRLLTALSRSRTRLNYHWSELWRSLLSFIKFMSTYSSDLALAHNLRNLLNPLIGIIALALNSGEAFLPDSASYDDLFYKIVETGPILTKFRDDYKLSDKSNNTDASSSSNIETMINVSKHYHDLLESESAKDKSILTPREVQRVIRKGYETLSIQAKEDLGSWERYREADEKSVLKRIARTAVEDTRKLLRR
ncbi:MAG: hypothetical protein M1834_003178 [Cirrosporium novae-zelandiae]|nr:MAG: hypothetical protein M1834_003178 [Cirrosporium novae-zelandiae]